MGGRTSRRASITPIPPIGTRGKTSKWVYSKYGDREEQLGEWRLPPDAEGESRAPQGYVITPQGELLVLDSEKDRLVWFAADGRMRRTLRLEGLVMPADVGVAADGTIAVMDHEGLHTKGTLLLTPEGEPKGMLPQSGGGSIMEMYVVGNDIMGGLGGSTIKLGETSGVPSHETPKLYDQDGTIPGHVAPDGRTIVDAGIENRTSGTFFISALRDDPPVHLFTRVYSLPVEKSLTGIPFLQSDASGTIYVVLHSDKRLTLVCIDGQSGDPLGSIALPKSDVMSGAAFRQWSVNAEQGGIVYHRRLEGASSFEIYDCR